MNNGVKQFAIETGSGNNSSVNAMTLITLPTKCKETNCTSLRRNAIKNYFLKKTEADNPREFWNAYRPFMYSWTSKQANDILLKEQNTVIRDKQQIADTFNDHFVNIANGAPEINEHDFNQ